MKISIISVLFVFAVCVFSANMVFATNNPIPGVDIIVKKKPGGIAFTGTTGRDGKFSCKLEKGSYELTLSYDQIKRALSSIDKNYASNPDGYVIESFFDVFVDSGISIFDRWGNLVKASTKLIINKESGIIKLTVAKGSGTLSGTLTYAANKIVIPNTKK